MVRRACENCNREFLSRNPIQKTCSRRCGHKVRVRGSVYRRDALHLLVCEYCAREFVRTGPQLGKNRNRKPGRFCSTSCSAKYRYKDRKLLITVPVFRECVVCARRLTVSPTRKIFCSAECRKADADELARINSRISYRDRNPVRELVCADCRKVFKARADLKYCSSRCSRRMQRRKRRALERGAFASKSVSPFRVFKLCGWMCALCGCYTPPELRGSVSPRSPELDHIIHLSRGGDHSYGNVQLLCRRCNGIKGAA